MADERIFYLHEFDSNGNPIDITKPIKRTIGQYVGNNSQKSGQRYAIDNDGSKEIHLKETNAIANTTTTPLIKFDGSHQAGAFSSFEDVAKTDQGKKAISIHNNSSEYGEFPEIHIKRGKEAGDVRPGTMTVPEMFDDENTTNGRIAQAVSKNLLLKTGYDNTNKRGANPEAPIPIQKNIGSYKKTGERFELAYKQYKNIGIKMLLEGSGELKEISNLDSDTEKAAFIASSPLAFSRLGVKVPYASINSTNIIKKSNPEFAKDNNNQFYGNPGFVNGSANNPLIVFDGFSNFAQTTTCYLLFTAVFATILGVAATYEGIQNRQVNNSNQTGRKNRVLNRVEGFTRLVGINTPGNQSFFGLSETSFDYTKCVRRGLRAFFGFGADGSLANSTMFVQNPGYSSVILRMIVSDTINIFGSSVLGSLIPKGFPSNTKAPSGVIEGIEQGSSTIEKLRTSKLLKFMNVVANIGDIVLALEEMQLDQLMDSDDIFESTELTDIASIVDNQGNGASKLNNAVKRSRLSETFGKKLSWSGETTPNLFLYSQFFEKARKKFRGDIDEATNNSYVNTILTRFSSKANNIKIDNNTVIALEKELNSSYLPFYFQDLRTNEIISFHGFLTDLSDGFSTQYEETEGYGRAGSVYSYKNTKRKTSVKFWMVATNKTDFDLMWHKLNRLIAMSQPMYTEGRRINFTEGDTTNRTTTKLIQPFSQIPGSTPVVRVRVGDLITSNKSKIDIARIHGFGNENVFAIENRQLNAEEIREIQETATLNSNEERDRVSASRVGFREGENYTFKTPEQVYKASHRQPNLPEFKLVNAPPPTIRRRGSATGQLTNINSSTTATITKIIRNNDSITTLVVKVLGTNYYIENNSLGILNDVSQEQLLVANTAGDAASQNTFNSRINEQTPTALDTNDELNKLQEMPVFKAFNDNVGEGMLAVIESISPNFDVTTNVWETEGGSVAPKMFEVAVDLLPMFDINPGLASDGAMIGSPYRVGRINHAMKALPYRASQPAVTRQGADGTAASSGTPTSSNDVPPTNQ